MATSLDQYIDPANDHPDAVAAADAGPVSDIARGLLIVRLGIELRRENRAGAEEAIMRLAGDARRGHELFQLMTAKLILALWTKDNAAILAALEAWLDARRPAPENWNHDVLKASEIVPHLAGLDPAKLALPKATPAKMTKADHALVKDLDTARLQAVTENLEWLRGMGLQGTVRAIAKAYRVTDANHTLREVTLSGKDDWPDLIVAVDETGAVIGSFIAH